jgi:hypothetical protein
METLQPKTEEELFAELSKLPDFHRFPLPKHWYEKFNIPVPKIPTIKEALRMHYQTQLDFLDKMEYEERQIAEGGVRPLLESAPLDIKVLPLSLKQIDLSGNPIDETPVSETNQSSS